jgi:hypothetical protein
MSDHCKRIDGSLRAWFTSKQAAEDFAEVTPGYGGDIAHLCSACGFWHCARPSWLASPEYLATVVTFTERVN